MHQREIARPQPGEYPPYASMYIDLVPDDDRVLHHLRENLAATRGLLAPLPAERLRYRYAAGKWTIKEILLHVVDDERIYAYRALRFARGDRTALPGFDQDDFARSSQADERALESILSELADVRRATISLFQNLSDEALLRTGVADGNRASVRALAYHIAGHAMHHLMVIKERYR